jgi:streptomycin 6-kinase
VIEISDVVRSKARVAGAEDWLSSIADLAAGLARDWELSLGRSLTGGTEAVVLETTRADGTPAVLKLCIPRERRAAEREALVLRLADGHGCARLYQADIERDALLLERLGPSMFELGVPYDERIALLCDAASAMWRPAPDVDVPRGDDTAHWLAAEIERRWELLARPCNEAAVGDALACCARRAAAHDDARAVLAHGDVHRWNALQASDGTFKLIDPDGLRIEPEYDLGIIMREDPDEGDLHERARFLAARTGCDETAIWEWGVIERVSTGLLGYEIGMEPDASNMLRAAERVAAGA